MISRRKRSISSAAAVRKFWSSALSGFELLAVDEEGARAGERVSVLVEVSEQRQAALFEGGGPVLVLALEPGDVVVDQLGGRGVVANDDEAGRDLDILLPPQLEGLRIVAIEGFESGLELDGEVQRVERGRLAAALPWHLLSDVVPEVAELRTCRRPGCCRRPGRGEA